MTDLEICKRIAEIEGLSPFIDSIYPSTSSMAVFVPIDSDSNSVYDPLSYDICSKALCFDLMVKYGLALKQFGTWFGVWHSISPNPMGSDDCLGYELNPQRAICLAIIEANKDK